MLISITHEEALARKLFSSTQHLSLSLVADNKLDNEPIRTCVQPLELGTV